MMRAMTPKAAGKIRPGLKSSTVMARTPSESRMRDDVRVDDRVEDAVPERHLDGRDLGVRGMEDDVLRPLRRLPVDLVQQCRQIGRHVVDDALLERLARGQVRCLTHGLLDPLHVATVTLCKRLEGGDCIVDDLAPQVLLDVLAADGDRGRRADVRLRGHRGDVRCLHDPHACRGSPRAVGRDVDDDRQRRLEHALVDVAHRLGKTARGVQEDRDRVVAVLFGVRDLVDDVVGRDRVDVVLEVDREHARPLLGGRRSGEYERQADRREEQEECAQ